MSVMEWNRLRAPQLRALAQEDCLVILPVGSTEQHGPHLPVQVDALLATEVSRVLLPDSILLEKLSLPQRSGAG